MQLKNKDFIFYISVGDNQDLELKINEEYSRWLQEKGISNIIDQPLGLGSSAVFISFIAKIFVKLIRLLNLARNIYLRVNKRKLKELALQYKPKIEIYVQSNEEDGKTLSTRATLLIAQKMKKHIYRKFAGIYEVNILSISHTQNNRGLYNTIWIRISKHDFHTSDLGKIIKKLNKIKCSNKTIHIGISESPFIRVEITKN